MPKKKEKVDVWKYKKYICTVKPINVYTGRKIIVLNNDEAKEHDIYLGYRTIIKYNGTKHAVLVDVSNDLIKPGEIGVYKEVMDELGIRSGSKIEIIHMNRPESLRYIKDKLDGQVLSDEAIKSIIVDLMRNRLSEVELAAWVSGVYMHGLSNSEIVALTKSIVNSGDSLNLNVKNVCDKHCIGGVAGNRTTMVIVPIIAAAGLYIPKSSSRAITSAAGTADVMELLASVDINMVQLKKIVKKVHGAIIWGGGLNLASADDKLIRIRNPLRLDPEGLLISSILAKKKSVNAKHVLIDIPIGRGTKIEDREKAKRIADHFIKIGKLLGMNVEAIITDGAEPIGNGIGVALEAKDVLEVLEGHGPIDLRYKSCILAGMLLEMSGKSKKGKGYDLAEKLISSGKALKKMKEIIKLQGGNPKISSGDIKLGKYHFDYHSKKTGQIYHIDNKTIAKLARLAGAPRDNGAGVFIHRMRGDKIRIGDILITVYADCRDKLGFAKKALNDLEPMEMRKIILGIVE